MKKSIDYLFVRSSLWLQAFQRHEGGQALTEYAMILSFVVLLLVVLLFFFGAQVELTYREILDQLPF